jgi:hypothetical protein
MSASKTAYFQGLRELAGKPIFVGGGEHDLEKEVEEYIVSRAKRPVMREYDFMGKFCVTPNSRD